jgi:hypothetical protein
VRHREPVPEDAVVSELCGDCVDGPLDDAVCAELGTLEAITEIRTLEFVIS